MKIPSTLAICVELTISFDPLLAVTCTRRKILCYAERLEEWEGAKAESWI